MLPCDGCPLGEVVVALVDGDDWADEVGLGLAWPTSRGTASAVPVVTVAVTVTTSVILKSTLEATYRSALSNRRFLRCFSVSLRSSVR